MRAILKNKKVLEIPSLGKAINFMNSKQNKRKYWGIITIAIMLFIVLGVLAGRELWIMKNKQTDINDVSTTENTSQKCNESDNTQSTEANNENTTDAVKPEGNDPDFLYPKSNDLFAEFYEQAEKLLKNMTLEEKVGQMYLARFPESGVIEEIENFYPGGYILFGRDFKNETKNSILAKLENCQNASKIKLVLGVDEEGGTESCSCSGCTYKIIIFHI